MDFRRSPGPALPTLPPHLTPEPLLILASSADLSRLGGGTGALTWMTRRLSLPGAGNHVELLWPASDQPLSQLLF